VESVLKKKRKATVGRLKKTGPVKVAFFPDPACVQLAIRYGVMNSPSGVDTPNSKYWGRGAEYCPFKLTTWSSVARPPNVFDALLGRIAMQSIRCGLLLPS